MIFKFYYTNFLILFSFNWFPKHTAPFRAVHFAVRQWHKSGHSFVQAEYSSTSGCPFTFFPLPRSLPLSLSLSLFLYLTVFSLDL